MHGYEIFGHCFFSGNVGIFCAWRYDQHISGIEIFFDIVVADSRISGKLDLKHPILGTHVEFPTGKKGGFSECTVVEQIGIVIIP